ncbi:hypothetical protein BDR04DRAFT_1123330 [Suillus decipiens]|nr:hypothetical protein BDR04DRAFT_1123330 [Suillus decipiens]
MTPSCNIFYGSTPLMPCARWEHSGGGKVNVHLTYLQFGTGLLYNLKGNFPWQVLTKALELFAVCDERHYIDHDDIMMKFKCSTRLLTPSARDRKNGTGFCKRANAAPSIDAFHKHIRVEAVPEPIHDYHIRRLKPAKHFHERSLHNNPRTITTGIVSSTQGMIH